MMKFIMEWRAKLFHGGKTILGGFSDRFFQLETNQKAAAIKVGLPELEASMLWEGLCRRFQMNLLNKKKGIINFGRQYLKAPLSES